jgi:4-diphosphocytidyl-2-C-methyl-D-erythritol kinase
MTDSILVRAPAKLNLALSVGPPLDSGFHPICSWMVTVDLCDELTLTRLDDEHLSRYAILWHPESKRPTQIDWPVTSDLAVRAHRALESHVGRLLPVQVRLDKRIPVGGGLGGGSSDAASMLHASNELFDLKLDLDTLCALGAQLGSDVPFLVRGGSAVVAGTGEQLSCRPPTSELHAVIVFPDVQCPTGEIYDLFDERGDGALRAQEVNAMADSAPDPELLFNDLTTAAVEASPQLQDHLSGLAELAERPAHLSGSGSSIFVLCDDALHAETLAQAAEQTLNLPAVAVRSFQQ